MDAYTFNDCLSDSVATCYYPALQAASYAWEDAPETVESVFFPGCSFLNYGIPLVQSVYNLLTEAGEVQGISLLCCGKILTYEPNGLELRVAYEKRLCARLAKKSVKRLIAACPNCTKLLRHAFANDPATADIVVETLPQALARMGYRIDAGVARTMLADELREYNDLYEIPLRAADEPENLFFTIHDSCPDRDLGEFADGIRTLLPEELVRESAHNRKTSFCCGSLLRAAGKEEEAYRQTRRHGVEALDAEAHGIATACMSCAFLLSAKQRAVPVFHYLELLYNWRLDWHSADMYMGLRFLLEGALEDAESEGSHRTFLEMG